MNRLTHLYSLRINPDNTLKIIYEGVDTYEKTIKAVLDGTYVGDDGFLEGLEINLKIFKLFQRMLIFNENVYEEIISLQKNIRPRIPGATKNNL